jgi:hypothetical protein
MDNQNSVEIAAAGQRSSGWKVVILYITLIVVFTLLLLVLASASLPLEE